MCTELVTLKINEWEDSVELYSAKTKFLGIPSVEEVEKIWPNMDWARYYRREQNASL